MKIKVSWIYLVLFVLGVIAAGAITGIFGEGVGIWVSYSFLGAYGIAILINAVLIEKVSLETVMKNTTLPESLGETKFGENTLETMEDPSEPPKEEPKKLSEEEIKVVQKIGNYIKDNLDKGHKLETIRAPLDKVYGVKAVDWVLQNAIKVEEPELPDLGEPEEIVTPETLKEEVKETKKRPGRPKKTKKKEKAEEPKEEKQKVEIVDPEHFK